MFRTLGLGIAIFSSLATAAIAADIPSRKYAPVDPVIVSPVFSWTGFYIGVNAGHTFGGMKLDDLTGGAIGSVLPNAFDTLDVKHTESFVGGGQIGYNYQMGSLVLGLEADMNYAKISTRLLGDTPEEQTRFGSLDGEGIVVDRTLKWFGTVRPRIGFAVNDQFLLFAAGGLAYGDVKESVAKYHTHGGVRIDDGAVGSSKVRMGWTLGGGFEYALTDSISLKAEYAYVDLGTGETNSGAPNAGDVDWKEVDRLNFHLVRAGLNYRF